MGAVRWHSLNVPNGGLISTQSCCRNALGRTALKEIFEKHSETIITIAILLAAIAGSRLLDAPLLYVFLATSCIIVSLIAYDLLKYKFFSRSYLQPLGWLYSNKGHFWVPNLQSVERAVAEDSTVILITDNRNLDANETETIETVSKNLARGVSYLMITSDTPENARNIMRCKQIHSSRENISINTLPDLIVRRRTLDNILVFLSNCRLEQKSGGLSLTESTRIKFSPTYTRTSGMST